MKKLQGVQEKKDSREEWQLWLMISMTKTSPMKNYTANCLHFYTQGQHLDVFNHAIVRAPIAACYCVYCKGLTPNWLL